MLGGKKVLLGICGSIAAYKSASLIRLLVKSGAEVQVVMTKAATEFITPLTLSTVSRRKVLIEFHEGEGQLLLILQLTFQIITHRANQFDMKKREVLKK